MPTDLTSLIQLFIDLINTAIPVLVSLTVLLFVWKLVDAWIINGGDETKRTEGRTIALTGVVVITIMLTVWAIIAFLRASFFG